MPDNTLKNPGYGGYGAAGPVYQSRNPNSSFYARDPIMGSVSYPRNNKQIAAAFDSALSRAFGNKGFINADDVSRALREAGMTDATTIVREDELSRSAAKWLDTKSGSGGKATVGAFTSQLLMAVAYGDNKTARAAAKSVTDGAIALRIRNLDCYTGPAPTY